MKTTSIYMGAMAFLVLLTGCSTNAHTPLRTGPALSLHLNVPTNGAYWVEYQERHVGRYGFQGEECRLEGSTRFVYQLRSVLRTRTGETRLAITPRFYTVNDWFVTPHGDRIRPPEIETLLKTLETVVQNHPFTITLSPGGTVIDTDGLTELENALAGVIGRHDLRFENFEPSQREAWRRVFMTHIDERPIRRHIQQAYGFLPDGYVRLGDRWVEVPANKPWPFLPTESTVRLIAPQEDHYLLETATEIILPPEFDGATYRGNTTGNIHLDAETRLGTEQQRSTYYKRKRNKTPWQHFTLKSLEASEKVTIAEGPFSASPHLYAIDRYPFLEGSPSTTMDR